MKRLAVILALVIPVLLNSQSCLPDGIRFNTQAEIDNFQTDYPGCTEIEGDVTIEGDYSIVNLIGLNVLMAIGGDLIINYHWNLKDLSGLDNLAFIGGRLSIFGNDSLATLAGLENLVFIGQGLHIGDSEFNEGNSSLTTLEALGNLTSIGGDLEICNNRALTSLAGLDNIDASSITNLLIYNNTSLPTCNIQSVCNYLGSPTGSVNIYNNSEGCNNPGEVATACDITLDCLPFGNYYFVDQSEIDNFQYNYPGCSQLKGDVRISQVSAITNLNGLSTITSIEKSLIILNTLLPTLSGLDSLTYIGGDLMLGAYYYHTNKLLTSLSGLENLDSIGGTLYIYNVPNLASLSGLEGLISIGNNLEISSMYPGHNYSLTSLTGLENLALIGGDLRIWDMDSLSDLTSLANLTSIGGRSFEIVGNDALTSLTGLDNIETASIEYLGIRNNSLLSNCEVQSICEYLGAPNANASIHDNASGCNSQEEVEEACPNCLPEGITFSTQAQVDSFHVLYPNCTEIEGDVTISGSNISNLNGLNVLTSIGDSLDISYNTALTSLTGLDNLTSIGGNLEIYNNTALVSLTVLDNLTSIGQNLYVYYNDSLTSLTGLDNLTSVGHTLYFYHNNSLTSLTGLDNLPSIGGSLVIDYNPVLTSLTGLDNLTSVVGGLAINENDSLTSLTELGNLTSVGGSLAIIENISLASLTGLDNIDANSILDLYIIGNSFLSACEVQSICDYIVSPSGTIEIDNNTTGCNSIEEVEEACASSINEVGALYGIKTQPNPFTTTSTIEFQLEHPLEVTITIFNHQGKQVELIQQHQSIGKQQITWNAEGLPPGMYFFKFQAGDQVATGKMMLVR